MKFVSYKFDQMYHNVKIDDRKKLNCCLEILIYTQQEKLMYPNRKLYSQCYVNRQFELQ